MRLTFAIDENNHKGPVCQANCKPVSELIDAVVEDDLICYRRLRGKHAEKRDGNSRKVRTVCGVPIDFPTDGIQDLRVSLDGNLVAAVHQQLPQRITVRLTIVEHATMMLGTYI